MDQSEDSPSPVVQSPSPVMPVIVLFLLGVMMVIPTMMTYDPQVYWTTTIAQAQTHLVAGAFFIPVCLLLAVQAFGIPLVNPIEDRVPSSPLVETISQTTSIVLVGIISALLVLIPFRNILLRGPWQPPQPTYARRRVIRRGFW